jgi:enterochelin esterase-like enzyme
MKKLLFCLTAFILFQLNSSPQENVPQLSCNQGQVLESLTMESKILGKPVKFSIYLPPDYTASNRSYPVVYLLHGYTDNETAWVQFGEVNLSADRAIASREIPPMIIVMPDAGVTWYVNDIGGKEKYEDMFLGEFIPYIDSHYRTRPMKEFRGISGLSMGGYGALLYSLHHPDVFSACVAFSAGVQTDEELVKMPDDFYTLAFQPLFGNDKNTGRITEHWKKNSILELANTLPREQIEKVRIMLDCGDGDFLYKGNSMLHIVLSDRQISHEYRVRDGEHNWTYWRTGITNGLKFIGDSFHR